MKKSGMSWQSAVKLYILFFIVSLGLYYMKQNGYMPDKKPRGAVREQSQDLPLTNLPTAEEEFYKALRDCDESRINRLLEEGVSPNAQFPYENTPLKMAVACKSPELIQRLLTAGADIHALNRTPGTQFDTALFRAVSDNQPQLVRILAAAGAHDVWDRWLWKRALELGHADVCRVLLEDGYTIPDDPFGVYQAAFEGKIAILKKQLPAWKKDRLEITFYGDELSWAVLGGHLEALKTLWTVYPWTTQQKGQAFRLAIRMGQADMVRFLLERGVPAQEEQSEGNGWHQFVEAAKGGHTTVVQLLLKAGVSPNVKNHNNSTALQHAINYNYVEMVQALLAAKVDLQESGPYPKNETPLYRARLMKRTEIEKLLLQAGAK